MSENLHQPVEEVFMWQPIIDGQVKDVPINVLSHPEAFAALGEQLHLYGGLGEERHATRKAIITLGEQGLVGVGIVLPFHHLSPEPRNLELTIVEAPQAIAEALNQRAGNPIDLTVDVIGHSQGGGVVLATASDAPEKFGAIAAWAPVGLTRNAFGNTPAEKRHRFYWRLGVLNALQKEQMFTDPGNFIAAREVLGRVVSDVLAGRLTKKLDYALSMDITQDVLRLAQDHHLAIFANNNDPLFRASEYRHALTQVGAESLLREIDGSHANLNNRGGRKQLAVVADWIKGTRDDRSRSRVA